jgi:hypothetical protein
LNVRVSERGNGWAREKGMGVEGEGKRREGKGREGKGRGGREGWVRLGAWVAEVAESVSVSRFGSHLVCGFTLKPTACACLALLLLLGTARTTTEGLPRSMGSRIDF